MEVTAAFYPLQLWPSGSAASTSGHRPHQAGRRAPRPRADTQGGGGPGPAPRRRLPRGLPARRRRGRAHPGGGCRGRRHRGRRPHARRDRRRARPRGRDRGRARGARRRGGATRTSGSTRARLPPSSTALGERFAQRRPGERRRPTAPTPRPWSPTSTHARRRVRGGPRAGAAATSLVTGHAAFGYLADRYDLSQEGIAGVSPESRAGRRDAARLVAHVRQHGVTTVYSETLVDPALAETVGRETGAAVAVLDPLEGITDASAGADYLEVMRSNLAALEPARGAREPQAPLPSIELRTGLLRLRRPQRWSPTPT